MKEQKNRHKFIMVVVWLVVAFDVVVWLIQLNSMAWFKENFNDWLKINNYFNKQQLIFNRSIFNY